MRDYIFHGKRIDTDDTIYCYFILDAYDLDYDVNRLEYLV